MQISTSCSVKPIQPTLKMKVAIVFVAVLQVVLASSPVNNGQNRTFEESNGHNSTYNESNNNNTTREDNTTQGTQETYSVQRESPKVSEEISTRTPSEEYLYTSNASSKNSTNTYVPTISVYQPLQFTTSKDLPSSLLIKFASNHQSTKSVTKQSQHTTATPVNQTNSSPSTSIQQSFTSKPEPYSASSYSTELPSTIVNRSKFSASFITPQLSISARGPYPMYNTYDKPNLSFSKFFQSILKPSPKALPGNTHAYSKREGQAEIKRTSNFEQGLDLTIDESHVNRTETYLHDLKNPQLATSTLPVFTTSKYEMMNDEPILVGDESTDRHDEGRVLQERVLQVESTMFVHTPTIERDTLKEKSMRKESRESHNKNTSKTRIIFHENTPNNENVQDRSSGNASPTIKNPENASNPLPENASMVNMGLTKSNDIVVKDKHNISLTDDVPKRFRNGVGQIGNPKTDFFLQKKRDEIIPIKKSPDLKKNAPENVSPTDTAVLKLDKNSSKLIGYSDDPFHVSDVLDGQSRNVEILHDDEKVDVGYPLIHYIQNGRTSIQRRTGNLEANNNRDSGTIANFNEHADDQSRNESSSDQQGISMRDPFSSLERIDARSANRSNDGNKNPSDLLAFTDIDDKQNASLLIGSILSLPVAEFRGVESGPAKPIIDDTSIIVNHLEDNYVDPLLLPGTLPHPVDDLPVTFPGTSTNRSTSTSVNRNSNYLMNSSEIIHHDGITYIRKNFLIMPINNNSIYKSNYRHIPSEADVPTTTEMSLLNRRVPIYQEIAGTMHIDSSIDDTLDSDEPISPATEDDGDEMYLPKANTSAVNLVDPAVKLNPDNSLNSIASNGVESEPNSSVSLFGIIEVAKEEDQGEASQKQTSPGGPVEHHGRSRRERHYSFVLKQKEELMSSLLDQSADPCQDFYQYACGGWTNRFTLRPDQAVDNTFERLRDDLDSVLVSLLEEESPPSEPPYTTLAKTLYRGCMDVDAIEAAGTKPLLELLDRLGGWPVLEGDSWDSSSFDVALQIARLRTLNNEVLLAESVADDVTNSSRRIVQLDQPKLGLPGRNYYLSSSDQKYRDAYLNLMLQACHLLGADPLVAMRDMAEVLFFETELAKVLVPAEERRNLSAIHRRYSRDKLKQEYSGISWDLYLDTIAPNHTAFTQEVRLFCHVYLHDLIGLLNNTEPRTVSNYLLWRLVKNRLGNLGSAALEVKQEYIRVLFGRSTQPNRWRSCITYVNGNLGGIVGSMFVARYFPEESRRDTEEMIGLIREAFRESVSEADWMLPETRETASNKVQAIVWNVGYPEELLNTTHMEETFGQLEFSPRSHFTNVLRMLRYHSERSHAQLGTPVNRTTWAAAPATVNAYYSRTKNMIMFPAGILQPPFYHPAYPRALNYGGIGVVIGHEISHGFDDGGRQFDRQGNLQQWWAKKDVMAFYARATCMLEQYSRFEVPELDMPVNAITTLGENIADNAGLNIAYTAYQKWLMSHSDTAILRALNLTLHQLFFLNFGQIWCEVNTPEAALTNLRSGRHSPNRFRVIGTLSNSRSFSEAFQCLEGTPMNPKDKCAVW